MTAAARNNYYWRFAVTVFCFGVFGAGGAVLGMTVIPLALLLPGSRRSRRLRIRTIVRVAFRSFVALMSGLGGLSYEIRGHQKLGRSAQLIIANHPSLLDVIFLIAFVPGVNCVIKRPLWRNIATAASVWGADYIPNAPTDEMVLKAAAALREGQAVIMFPEGTRTRPERPICFHRGAAAVAVRAATIITPVFVKVRPTTQTKSEPWYSVPVHRPHFSLLAGDDIDPGPFRAGASRPKASRALNDYLLSVYSQPDASQ